MNQEKKSMGPFNPPKPPICPNCGLYESFVGMHTRTCQCPKEPKPPTNEEDE